MVLPLTMRFPGIKPVTFYPVGVEDAHKLRADVETLLRTLQTAVGSDALSPQARTELMANALARAELLHELAQQTFRD